MSGWACGSTSARASERDPRARSNERFLFPKGVSVNVSTYFSSLSNWLAKWTGSHWAFLISAATVVVSLSVFGVGRTNIAISVVSLLMLFILQNTQNRDSAALHVKLDEVITHLHGPRDEVAGIESKTHEEIEELRSQPK
jgi:low affinity Fe/Cu permease